MNVKGFAAMAGVILVAVLVASLTGGGAVQAGPRVKTFCEYGHAVAVELTSQGGLWAQDWGLAPVEWFECDADPNNGLLNSNVRGTLVSWATDYPEVDYTTLCVRMPLAGNLTLTSNGGEIGTSFAGDFLIDGGAPLSNASLVDEVAGTIQVPFGRATFGDASPMVVTVTSTTGKYKTVQQVEPWSFYVAGYITLARVPSLDLYWNILAALQNSDLILGAQEQIVLTGSYVRCSSRK